MFEYLMKHHDYTPYTTSVNTRFDKMCFWTLTNVYRRRYNERIQLAQMIRQVIFLKREEVRYQMKIDRLHALLAAHEPSNPAGLVGRHQRSFHV